MTQKSLTTPINTPEVVSAGLSGAGDVVDAPSFSPTNVQPPVDPPYSRGIVLMF